MRLVTQLIEELSGHRSIRAELNLHGSHPSAWTQLKSGRLVDLNQWVALRGGRVLAQLWVGAPDELPVEQVAARLRERRAELAQHPGKGTVHDDIVARFIERDKRITSEREAVLEQLLDASVARLQRRRQWTPLRISRLILNGFRGIDRLGSSARMAREKLPCSTLQHCS